MFTSGRRSILRIAFLAPGVLAMDCSVSGVARGPAAGADEFQEARDIAKPPSTVKPELEFLEKAVGIDVDHHPHRGRRACPRAPAGQEGLQVDAAVSPD